MLVELQVVKVTRNGGLRLPNRGRENRRSVKYRSDYTRLTIGDSEN